MTNEEYQIFRQGEWKRLECFYDFNSIEGVRSIPVPCKEVNDPQSATGRVEYYLRCQCLKKHLDNKDYALVYECIKKAHQLMFISDMIWGYEAYISSISLLHNIGMHQEAREEEKKIDDHFAKVGFYPKFNLSDLLNLKGFINSVKFCIKSEKERIRKRNLRHEYYWLQENLPELCPKSLSAYSRMKNSNSKNYQKLLYAMENKKGDAG